MTHTPEPWELVGYSLHGYQDRYISYLDDCDEKDARRIVACVNACAGISDEHLADDCVRKMREDRDYLLAENASLKADADRLAEALKCQIETADMDERTRNYALSQARTALTAHKEQS